MNIVLHTELTLFTSADCVLTTYVYTIVKFVPYSCEHVLQPCKTVNLLVNYCGIKALSDIHCIWNWGEKNLVKQQYWL